MITLRQSNDYEPGTWKGLQSYKRSASATCPECGRTCSLLDHTIADDGAVHPSLVCPYDDCSFHEWVKLEGWASA